MKATKKELIEEMKELAKKYQMLVWYARKLEEQIATIPEVRATAYKVTENYPEEVASLNSPLFGNWQHGFNSGMLAGARFVLDALDDGIDEAYQIFPDLNS